MSRFIQHGAFLLRNIINGGQAEDQAVSAEPEVANEASRVLCLHEILVRVLSFLDVKERMCSVAFVGKGWFLAALDPILWRELLDEQVVKVAGHNATGRQLSLGRLQWALHCRNLLRNPSFQEDANTTEPFSMELTRRHAWIIREQGGDGISWECPPAGTSCEETGTASPPAPLPYPRQRQAAASSRSPLRRLAAALLDQRPPAASSSPTSPALAGQPPAAVVGCIATSHQWCELVQVVDLVEELARRGIQREAAEQLLDCGLPLGLTIWVGARWDCASQFAVGLMLEDAHTEVTNFQHFVRRASSHHFYSGKVEAVQGRWSAFKYLVPRLPQGCRRAILLLRGKDMQFWAGHYGAKFASAEMRFLRRADAPAFGAEASQAFWAGRKIAQSVEGLFGGPEAGVVVVWGQHQLGQAPEGQQEGQGMEQVFGQDDEEAGEEGVDEEGALA